MRLFVCAAEDRLKAAALEVAESAATIGAQVAKALPRLRGVLARCEEQGRSDTRRV
jgi:hypothetical protein